MKIKEGVSVKGIKPELLLALQIADNIWKEFGEELIITSCTDGTHRSGSLHAFGYAADLRTRYFSLEELSKVTVELSTALGNEYDVVVESTHIHMEYDPR